MKTCVDIDECTENKHNCDSKAYCTDTDGSYTCNCYTGFSGDGETCVDIDECENDTHKCHLNANCQNEYYNSS